MVSRRRLGLPLAAVVVALLATAAALALHRDRWFEPLSLPVREMARLFDLGVVDANADGNLDLYSSNHHFRQFLWLGDGKGGFHDVLSEWGLDQSREFPLAELSFVAPRVDRPGVYLYWKGAQFVVQVHHARELGAWNGTLSVLEPVRVASDRGFNVDVRETRLGQATQSRIAFSAGADAQLVLVPGGQGVPLEFRFEGGLRTDQIFVGLGRVSPKSTTFALAMQDRHALAWADINGDGLPDVFITRGALSGTLRAMPEAAAQGVRDELLLSRGLGRFDDMAVAMGIEKKGCSGRHAKWVDIDGDGVLELFVNCFDREAVAGEYPKQLYRRNAAGRFEDLAESFGLGLPHDQMGSFAWVDVDGDGDVDLLALQDEGIVLYRNQRGRFVKEPVAKLEAAASDRIGQSTESAVLFDGKITVCDFDGDGDFDAFLSSKRGNVLLRNDAGRFVPVVPTSVGLPDNSLMASWVDFDNDGRPDLHLVPQGIYRQRPNHTFEATGLFEFDPRQYKAAIVNWLDIDNDGRLDVVLALARNRDFRPWWRLGGSDSRSGDWEMLAFRNKAAKGHWLEVILSGPEGNRDGIGAIVTLRAGGATQSRIVGANEGSFFSQGHYRAYFGLGETPGPALIAVRWPDGTLQEAQVAKVDRLVTLRAP